MRKHKFIEDIDLETLITWVYSDSLNSEEKEALETIKNDEERAHVLKGIQMIKDEFGFKNPQEHIDWLREEQSQFEQEQKWVKVDLFGDQENHARIIHFTQNPWAIASVAAILLLILGYFFFPSKSHTEPISIEKQLAERNPFDASNRARNRIDSLDEALTLYDSLSYWYDRKDFDQGIKFLENRIIALPASQYQLIRYQAFLNLVAGNESESIDLFQQLANDPNTPYTMESWLVLGLAYLKLGNQEKAIEIFKQALERGDQVSLKEQEAIQEMLNHLGSSSK